MNSRITARNCFTPTILAVISFAFFGNIIDVRANSSVTDEINITIPSSCSLTNTVGSAHTATIETGVYQENIGETTFKVFCNDSEGFSVYAVGYTNDEFGNNTLKPAVVDNSNAVATGTATSGNTSNWAMKLSAVSGTYAPTVHSTEENNNTYSFTSYHTIPSEYTKVASYSSNTDVTTGSSFKSTYAAFISQTQLADSYTGKVKYTVVHPSSELAPIENIAQLTYMQDFKDLKADERTAVLNSMQYNTTYNLIDNRDNKTYQIARLKDDNIWMAENLDLGRTELTQDLTSQNTNLSEAITASTFNNWIKSSSTYSYTSAEIIPVSGTDYASNTPYGTLYNYCAVSANTICSAEGTNNYDTSSDICPAGWRLPTGNTTGEFQALYSLTDYNTATKMRNPIESGGASFALAGYFDISTPTSQGSGGRYWSSTKYDGSSIYFLSLYTSSVYPVSSYNRRGGIAVRCVAKRPFRALTVSYGTGVSGVQLNGITIQNGGVVNLEEGMSYQVTITPAEGYALSDWTSTSGSIGSNTSETTTYTIGSNDATLIANAMLAIQNLDSSNCTSTASQVVDNRDGHVYTIQRLADGRCWMMENLDLGRTELTKDLTNANTNLVSTITASAFNSWKKSSGTRTYDSGEFIPITASNSYNSLDRDSISGTPYGTIYNYYAASAGTIASSINTESSKYDICPSRWRLPTGDDSGEYWVLSQNASYDTLEKLRAPINENGAAFNYSGAFFDSIPKEQGEWGYYWSSNRSNDTNMRSFYIKTSRYGFISTDRAYGTAIRCILDETSISNLTYMQDFNSLSHAAKTSVYNTMADNTVYSLIDNRDNKSYQIARLEDGNIWMAENLDLGRTTLTTDLTSTNTNLSTTVTASTFNSWKKTTSSGTFDSGEYISINGTDSTSEAPYGTLYNYYAASGGTISGTNSYVDAVYDICPAGWRLPTGGETKGELYDLYGMLGYTRMRSPISQGGAAFTLAGHFVADTPTAHRWGYYWSSTHVNSGSDMSFMRIDGYYLSADFPNVNRHVGQSVRCVAK